MVGRQSMIADGRRVRSAFLEAGRPITLHEARRISIGGRGYAESLLSYLGADTIASLDASPFEGSTIVHNLNQPLPPEHHSAYSAVLDGGTLEHVFDFGRALKRCLEAVAVGGHYLAITPVNNYTGHGFYQLTPELYHRVLGTASGFEVKGILWRSEIPCARWYQVADPAEAGHRVERRGLTRAMLFVVAQRVEEREILGQPPMQSDYVAAWEAGPAVERMSRETLPGVKGYLARHTPAVVKDGALFVQQLRSARGSRYDFNSVRLDVDAPFG
jgi:hypothetical protein